MPRASGASVTGSVHKRNFKRWAALVGALLLILGIGFMAWAASNPALTNCALVIPRRGPRSMTSYASFLPRTECVQLERVATPAAREQGLSGRQVMLWNSGMLFVFDQPDTAHCFWMKDMYFNIDIIWVGSDKKVVHIKENASPGRFPETYCPPSPAQYVVEVNAGIAREAGVRIGQTMPGLQE